MTFEPEPVCITGIANGHLHAIVYHHHPGTCPSGGPGTRAHPIRTYHPAHVDPRFVALPGFDILTITDARERRGLRHALFALPHDDEVLAAAG